MSTDVNVILQQALEALKEQPENLGVLVVWTPEQAYKRAEAQRAIRRALKAS